MKRFLSAGLILLMLITGGCADAAAGSTSPETSAVVITKGAKGDVQGESTTPQSTEASTTPPAPDKTEISLLAVGDVMFHMPQVRAARTAEGGYDFTPVYRHVRSHIEEADLAIANYETVTVSDREFSGYPNFNSPIESVEALKEVGFDILSTANNHSLDQGRTGILSTIDAIEENGMKHVGTSRDRNRGPLIHEVEGIEIGVISYTYGLNGLESRLSEDELTYMVNVIDEEKIREDVEYLKDEKVDLIVAYLHWGNEYQREPADSQKILGRKMAEWGVDIIFGSHPHVLQKAETIEIEGRDHFIAYSMGNFISNQGESTMGNIFTEDGIMIRVHVEKDVSADKTRIREVEYIPTWVNRYGDSSRGTYEIIPVEDVINGTLELDLKKSALDRIQQSYEDFKKTFGK